MQMCRFQTNSVFCMKCCFYDQMIFFLQITGPCPAFTRALVNSKNRVFFGETAETNTYFCEDPTETFVAFKKKITCLWIILRVHRDACVAKMCAIYKSKSTINKKDFFFIFFKTQIKHVPCHEVSFAWCEIQEYAAHRVNTS